MGEREEGEKMVTGATLFDKLEGEQFLYHRDSLGETVIGAVPKDVKEAKVQEAIHAAEVADNVDMASTLDPLRDSVTNEDDVVHQEGSGVEVAKSSPTPPADNVVRNAFGQKIRKASPRNGVTGPNQIWLWLPIKFRPVPKKGDFDVNRLRESTYFFS